MNQTKPGTDEAEPDEAKPSEPRSNQSSAGATSSEKPAADGNSFPLFEKPVTAGRGLLLLAILVSGVLADLLTKQFIFGGYFQKDAVAGAEPVWLIGSWFGIQTSTNQGALFGMGQGFSVVFAVLSVIALSVLIFLLFFKRWANDLFIAVTFSMIAGGIIGNLYDRLGLWHGADVAPEHANAVRDWIHFRWSGGPKIFDPWPNFNIADCLLVCGAILLCFHAFFIQPKMEAAANAKLESEKESGKTDEQDSDK